MPKWFTVYLTSPAQRVHSDLAPEDRKIIEGALLEISSNPFSSPYRRIAKLRTVDKYRYRAERSWRIIYSINPGERAVYIESIRKRGEDTYRRLR